MSVLSSLGNVAGTALGALSGVSSTSRSSTLGQTDFLNLLVTQLRYQNPMEPMKDTEFVAQMAQFSSLDGINKMNQNLTDLLTMQGLAQGTNLIGKTIAYSKDASGAIARGTVASVRVDATGKIQLMVGTEAVALSQVRSVEAGPTR